MHKGAKTLALATAFICTPCWCAPPSATMQDARRQDAPPAPEKRVDINQASLEQLLKVPGMTRPWAERIVRFRPYRSKQDLVDNGILSVNVYNRVKDYVIAHREKK